MAGGQIATAGAGGGSRAAAAGRRRTNRSTSAARSGARCSRCWRWPRAGRCRWTTWWTRCGRRRCRSRVGRPCTATCPGCAGQLGPAAARLETGPDGYRLVLDDDGLDVAEARALLASARSCAGHDPARASALLREALALWRGPVLADLTDVLPIATAVEECTRLHREVTDALIGSAIAAGHADEVVGLAAASADRRPAARTRGPAADAGTGGDGARTRGAANRARVPAPAGRGDRPRPVAGAGRAGADDRRRGRRSGGPARRVDVRPADPADRPGGRGRRAAAAARRANDWSRSSGPAAWARPGSPWRSADAERRRRCCCWHRSPIRRPSPTRWPRPSACRSSRATCCRPVSPSWATVRACW